MTRLITGSLWVKQTIYTIVVAALVAIAVAGYEILTSYYSERDRLQSFGNALIDSFSDTAARAAYHVDKLQAESVVDGLMQYDELREVVITTDLGLMLARGGQSIEATPKGSLANRLFSDVTAFERQLSVDSSIFTTGGRSSYNNEPVHVGQFQIYANSTSIGRSFIDDVQSRIVHLIVEFLILAAALAFIFYRTITKPIQNVAEQLETIDPQGSNLAEINLSASDQHNELGLVVSRTNDLLHRIGDQQNDLVHREKLAALGSMLAEVAHELNNPLAVVITQAELLAETATDQKTRDRAEKILKPAKRSAGIVRKFLTLTRQRKVEKTVLDGRRLIRESVDMLSYQLAKSNIVVNTEVQPGLMRIWGDSAQLMQVFINVLINAQQALVACTGTKEITIRASSDEIKQEVVITISDNGPGIPESIQAKVFNHFFTTKTEGHGTGLGLSFSKTVVEGHNGTIGIAGVEPHGTEVMITLTGTTKTADIVAGHAHPGKFMASLNMLIVDDEEELAKSVEEALTNHGHSAVITHSALEALNLLRTESFDIILADIHMPGIDGRELYWMALDIDIGLAQKFVFITGDSLDPKLVKFFTEQKKIYLNKPFEMDELFEAIEQVILSPTSITNVHILEADNSGV